MTSHDDDSRDEARRAILRRRAFFVTSTLGALGGCRHEPPPPAPQPAGASASASVTASAVASAVVGEGSASAPSPVPTAGHFEMPPLDVPDGVGPTATTHYESLARSVPEIHRRLDAVEAALRDLCQPKTPRCDGSFKDLAKELGEIDDAIRRLPPRCQGSSEVAKAFDERLTRHLELLRDRRRAIDDQTATDLDDEAEARWKKLLADEAVPQPCLRFSCEDW